MKYHLDLWFHPSCKALHELLSMVVQDSVSNNPNHLESFEWWLIFVGSFELAVRMAQVNARPCVFEQSLLSCPPKKVHYCSCSQQAAGTRSQASSHLAVAISQQTGANLQAAGESLLPVSISWFDIFDIVVWFQHWTNRNFLFHLCKCIRDHWWLFVERNLCILHN